MKPSLKAVEDRGSFLTLTDVAGDDFVDEKGRLTVIVYLGEPLHATCVKPTCKLGLRPLPYQDWSTKSPLSLIGSDCGLTHPTPPFLLYYQYHKNAQMYLKS